MTLTPLRSLLVTVLVVAAAGVAVAVAVRSHHGGSSGTQARTVAPFRAVELAGSNNVVIHVGARQSVVVKADHNLLHRVTTRVRGSRLVIGNTPGSFRSKRPMSVEIGVPALSALTLSGSGTMTASGTATTLDVAVTGSGTVQLASLVARDVHALVSGSGSIFVTATDRLDALVSGSGAIIYSGHPTTVTKNVTGSGTIVGG